MTKNTKYDLLVLGQEHILEMVMEQFNGMRVGILQTLVAVTHEHEVSVRTTAQMELVYRHRQMWYQELASVMLEPVAVAALCDNVRENTALMLSRHEEALRLTT